MFFIVPPASEPIRSALQSRLHSTSGPQPAPLSSHRDRALFPYILALHTTSGAWLDPAWRDMLHLAVCRNTSQQSTSTPMLLDSFEVAGLLLACLPRFTPSMSRASVPNEWSIHHFVFELPFPNIIFHPGHGQHTSRPKNHPRADLFSSPTHGFLVWATATGCECTSYIAISIDSMMQKETAAVDPKPPADPFARPYRVKASVETRVNAVQTKCRPQRPAML
ncbi:hypothetical protein CGRA01v4_02969 [Colletotrichum graminicola]|nr:hypothetical protein CGRA01v4_02969 [Colletotrichum graminicola]